MHVRFGILWLRVQCRQSEHVFFFFFVLIKRKVGAWVFPVVMHVAFKLNFLTGRYNRIIPVTQCRALLQVLMICKTSWEKSWQLGESYKITLNTILSPKKRTCLCKTALWSPYLPLLLWSSTRIISFSRCVGVLWIAVWTERSNTDRASLTKMKMMLSWGRSDE